MEELRVSTPLAGAGGAEFRARCGLPVPAQVLVPDLDDVRHLLPQVAWPGHEQEVELYWRAWELAFAHLRAPGPDSGFVATFLDTAFNDCLFLWDSVFALAFGRVGRRAHDFQATLDNLYACQHEDGFVCREIAEVDGSDRWSQFDPVSTGPDVLAWSEWEHYRATGDLQRLERVFPSVLAYTQWTAAHRRWPDGTYWNTGLGSGMDNLPRFVPTVLDGGPPDFRHGRMTWVDANAQAVLAIDSLSRMARVLGREAELGELPAAATAPLEWLVNSAWDRDRGFLYDTRPDGSRADLAHVGAFWALLLPGLPSALVADLLAKLEAPDWFATRMPVPGVAAHDPRYIPGGYWSGGTWAPTSFLAVLGARRVGRPEVARRVARAHLDGLLAVYQSTGTLWENYSSDGAGPGAPSAPDFVGWTGLGPIAGLLEGLLGISYDTQENHLTVDGVDLGPWSVRGYPIGGGDCIDIEVDAGRVRLSGTGPLPTL